MFYMFAGLLWLAQPLTFADALALAERAPSLQAAERVSSRRQAAADGMSRLTSNPSLQVQPGGRRMSAGGRGAELYLGINQRLSLGGYGEKRKVSVAREVEHDAALFALTRQRVRRAVAEAWLARWAAQQAMLVAASERQLAEELAQRIGQTLAAGEATRVDLAVATAWRAEAALSALAAEGDAFVSGIELSQALGVTSDAPQAVLSELPAIDLPDEPTLAARLGDGSAAPAVRAAQAERASEHARFEEVGAARAPQLAVGAIGWREGAGDLAAVATFEVEIPVFERGQRERATQAAAIARAEAAALDANLEAHTERVIARHEVEHSQQVLETTEQQLLGAAEGLAEAQRLRLEAREATAQEWVQARRAVLSAKLAALRARADHVLARFVARELWQMHEAQAAGKKP